jgi:hypothetical protein
MSGDRPSIAESIYGPSGPISGGVGDPRTQAIIQGGIARPAAESNAPAARPPLPNSFPTRPEAPVMTPAPGPSGAFDPARWQPPEGHSIDQGLLDEFGTAAGELGLDHAQAERLLELHHKAAGGDRTRLETTWNEWSERSQREFGDSLPRVVAVIESAVGGGHDAERFFELLRWSGLEWEPSVLRVLHKLSNGRRY